MRILDRVNLLLRQQVRARGGRSVLRVAGGRRMHGYELDGWGSGPPLVLVHGLGASGSTFARLMFELRSNWRKIYVPDLPGHGFSPLEPGEQPLGVREHYEALAAWIDTVVKEPAAMVGNSLGGALSLRRALDREDTRGVGLLAPAGAPLDGERLEALRRSYALADRSSTMELIDRMFHRRPLLARLVAGDLRETFGSAVVQQVLTSVDGEEGLDVEGLRNLRMPVTLLWGASERLLPEDGIDFFRRHLPDHARIVVVDRCGHVPQIERPRKTLHLLDSLAAEVQRAHPPARISAPA